MTYRDLGKQFSQPKYKGTVSYLFILANLTQTTSENASDWRQRVSCTFENLI
jgi:hypothetical protein